jgi:Flagellar hook-length control protein FliK
VTLAKGTAVGGQMTVRLHPAELRMLQVRIERAATGMTQIDITADNPETLQALQRDQSALHRTLDDPGIHATGRTVTFHAVEPTPDSTSSGGNRAPQSTGQLRRPW